MELNTKLWLVVLDGVELGVDRQDGVCGVAKPMRQQPTTSSRGPTWIVWGQQMMRRILCFHYISLVIE